MNPTKMTRKEWIEATRRRLDALDRSLTELEGRASSTKERASEEVRARLRSTRQSLDAARSRWEALQDTAAEVWDAVSEEISSAWDANRDALETSVREISEAMNGGIPEPPKASEGDRVRVRCQGEFEDGTRLTRTNDPFEFTIGETPPIPGIAEVVEGLRVGEAVSVTIPAEDMFGNRRSELILKVPVTAFPGNAPPQLGDRFELRPEEGEPVRVTVRRVIDGLVEVDANHPLAGNDLHVDLELVGVTAGSA